MWSGCRLESHLRCTYYRRFMDEQLRRDGLSKSRGAKQQAPKQTASGTLPPKEVKGMLICRYNSIFGWIVVSFLAGSSSSGRHVARCNQYPSGAVHPLCAVGCFVSVERGVWPKRSSGVCPRIPALVVCLFAAMLDFSQTMGLDSTLFVLRRKKQPGSGITWL